MQIDVMQQADLALVLPIYIDYYNCHEGGCWTEATATRRIQQVMHMDDAYCLILKDDTGAAYGFVMGYFKQYDDVVGYTLEEILIAAEHQGKGLGSILLAELERRVKEKGASCVELQAVKDDMHERYYGKAGFNDAKNFVLKVKWFA